jgi:hypothetical protein
MYTFGAPVPTLEASGPAREYTYLVVVPEVVAVATSSDRPT